MTYSPHFPAQVDCLVSLAYPGLAGLSEPDFRARLAPLEERVPAVEPAEQAEQAEPVEPVDAAAGRVPWVLVVSRDLIPPEPRVPLLRLAGGRKPGVVDRNHDAGDLATYDPLPEIGVPAATAYLLLDVERGEEFCGVKPEDALPVIRGRRREPLTIDEGIALVTQAPELLVKNQCFMLSGSRRRDRRVPALWISERAPKLGWCWDGNPHSWLGVASAGGRSGP